MLFSVTTVGLLTVWYATSSLSSQLNKAILVQFPFPLFLTEVLFLGNMILALITAIIAKHYPPFHAAFPSNTFPSNGLPSFTKPLAKLFLPMGVFQFVGKLLALAATTTCSVATVSSIRSLSPLFIVLGYRIFYKVAFPLKTYLSLLPLLLGVIIVVLSQSSITQIKSAYTINEDNAETVLEPFNMFGIIYIIMATSVFAAGSIYAKNVVSKHSNINCLAIGSHQHNKSDIEKSSLSLQSSIPNHTLTTNNTHDRYQHYHQHHHIDKLTTIIYCSIYGLLFSIPTFLTYELKTIFNFSVISQNISLPYYSLIPWHLLIVNIISYFAQTLLAFHLLTILPTISYSIASMMKRIIIIAISIFLRDAINPLEWLGLIHIALGLYVYERWGLIY